MESGAEDSVCSARTCIRFVREGGLKTRSHVFPLDWEWGSRVGSGSEEASASFRFRIAGMDTDTGMGIGSRKETCLG